MEDLGDRKGRDALDAGALEGEHLERFRDVASRVGVSAVCGGCQLTACAGRDEPPLVAAVTPDEAGDHLAALPPGGPRRHRGAALRAGVARRPAVALAVAAAAVATATAVALDAPETPATAPEGITTCNGSAELCERRLDEVVFAGTHNSYAASDRPRWYFANQRRPISRQLEDGIRALLLDIHLGVRDGRTGRVRTDVKAEGGTRNKAAQALSPEALRLADRLAGRVGAGQLSGRRRLYLCHTLCELGAEPLDQELAAVRDFLVREPGEVVMLVLGPYVGPPEIEQALECSELLGQAAALDLGAPLPTLGDLVDAETRLVVLTAADGGARPWCLPAFAVLQDTPLGARRPEQLRCTRFRGEVTSPLLKLNHWIDRFPPRPSQNAQIGRAEILRERSERCARARGVRGGILAVDFHDRSDVVAVAQDLNRAG